MAPSTAVNHVPITGRAGVIVGVSMTEMSIALGVVGLRLYAAATGSGRIRLDFWFVLVGTMIGVATEAMFVMACKNGIGRTLEELEPDQIWQALRWINLGTGAEVVAAFVARLGIVALLYNVATINQWKRKAFLLTIGGLNVVCGTVALALNLTQCTPYQKLWYRLLPGDCPRNAQSDDFGVFQGSFVTIVDLILAGYPVTIVWKLQASLRVKLGFCVLMAGGVFGAVGAALRTYYGAVLRNAADPIGALPQFIIWSSTELWLVVIIACVPPLRPLFLRWYRKTTSLVSGSAPIARTGYGGTGTAKSALGTVAVAMHEMNAKGQTKHKPNPSVVTTESEEAILAAQRDQRIMISQSYTIHVEN